MTKKHPRLDAFEMLPDEARKIVQQVLDAVASRRMPQRRAYDVLAQHLEEIGIPNDEVKLPSFSSFNRLVARRRPVFGRATGREANAASPLSLSGETRALLAVALRALADDLDGGTPQKGGVSAAALHHFRERFFGPPVPFSTKAEALEALEALERGITGSGETAEEAIRRVRTRFLLKEPK